MEWPARNLIIVNVPVAEGATQQQYAMNALTGAWSKWSAVNAGCWALFGTKPYFGDNGGLVHLFGFEEDDNGSPIVGSVQHGYSQFRTPRQKAWKMARPNFTSQPGYVPFVTMLTDFSRGLSGASLSSLSTAGIALGRRRVGRGVLGRGGHAAVQLADAHRRERLRLARLHAVVELAGVVRRDRRCVRGRGADVIRNPESQETRNQKARRLSDFWLSDFCPRIRLRPGVLVGSVLYGADMLIADMVASRIPHVGARGFGACAAIGVVRSGRLIGGVVWHNFRGHDIEVSAAFDRADWARPSTLSRLFAYPFVQLSCARITALTGRKNKRTRRFLRGIGFREEGVIRRGLDGREDAVIYGMLRSECRVLTRKKLHG